MTIGIADTTVVIHLYRRYSPAIEWYRTVSDSIGVTPITWMEVVYGAGSKAKQIASKALLDEFELLYLTATDQRWAMEQLEQFQFSHHIGMNDCMIASVAHRLQLPLYTHNLKDMTPMIGALAVKPYA